ncbi:MAG: glycosyltransferase family 39 protein, partial [Actinomycetota bacterium]|nr:glycosyltransferase family 39 protein [Actinomycetota bacterium]
AVAQFHDFARGEKYPGLYLYGEDLLVPQFFPGPFAFLGLGNLAGGLWGSLYVVPVFGALAVGLAFLLGSELFGRWAGLLGAALLATSYTQVWWSRQPSSEIVTQFFVLGGLWLSARFFRGGGGGTGLMAGLLFGGAMLVRVDAFLAASVLPLLAGYDLFVGRPVRRWLYPAVPLVLAGLAGLVYLNTIAGRYLNLIYGRHDLDEALKLVPYAVVAAVILAVILWIVRRRLGERVNAWLRLRGGRVAAVGALAIVGVALWGYFVLPVPWESLPNDSRDYDAYREQIFVRLTWFVTPPVALLVLLGLVLAARRRPDAARMLLFGAILSFGALYTAVPNVAPDLPWATRRFVPAVFPGAALLAGFAVVEVGRGLSRLRSPRAGLALTGALAVLSCAWTIHTTLPILTFRELEGAVAAFDRIESEMPDADVIFVEVPDATDRSASTFEFLYGRPVLPYSRDRFRQERDELKEAGLLDDALYVTLDGMPAPLISGFEFDEVAREEAILPRLDPVEGDEAKLSTRVEPLQLTYKVYHLETERR